MHRIITSFCIAYLNTSNVNVNLSVEYDGTCSVLYLNTSNVNVNRIRPPIVIIVVLYLNTSNVNVNLKLN